MSRNDNHLENERVMIRRLGDGKEYRAIIKGYYACDSFGNPDAYIVELLDKIPGSTYEFFMSHRVFVRAVVDADDWSL